MKNLSNKYAENIMNRAIKTKTIQEAKKILSNVRPGEVITIKYGQSYLTSRIIECNNAYSYECFIGLDERALEESDTKEDMLKNIDTMLNSMFMLYDNATT